MERSGKAIVITGVTRGLGLAMARGIASEGHTIVGCGRSVNEIERLRQTFGEPHFFSPVDVSSADEVERWAADVSNRVGAPDILINNAAIINRNGPLWELGVGEFSQLIDINIKGVFHVIRAFLPAMIARRSGVVVNMSSGWGRTSSPEVASYCTSKWAIEGLTASLSKELPRGLAAVALNPGVINTSMLQSCFGAGAGSCPDPEVWAKFAIPMIMSLGMEDNGCALSVSA
ncbi:MAG: SDR family oxidoreductase [Opitutales bacterium]